MRGARLDESQAGIKIVRRKINNLRCADDTTLMAESGEELKSLLKKVKEEGEKVGLKLNTQKIKIMASSPITSRQVGGQKWKLVDKRRLLLGRKARRNLDSVLKGRDITLLTKV